MQYDDIEIRRRETDDRRVVEIDGYHHVQPDSKSGEYRRVPIVDLTEKQARELHARLGEILDELEAADGGP